MSRPPTSGPIASASAETPAQIPIAIPRSFGGKVAAMIDSVAGFISAAPAPWTTRAMISISPESARPHQSEAPVKIDDAGDEDEAAAVGVGELAADQHQRREA